MATWIVPYQPGTLEAIGYRDGKKVASQTLRTLGDAAKIKLTPDRKKIKADGYDLSFVTVEVLDKTGKLHPNADNEIKFSIKGPGEILAVGNGDQASVELFQAKQRKAHNGRCLVVVKSARRGGKIELAAKSKGLASAKTSIMTR